MGAVWPWMRGRCPADLACGDRPPGSVGLLEPRRAAALAGEEVERDLLVQLSVARVIESGC